MGGEGEVRHNLRGVNSGVNGRDEETGGVAMVGMGGSAGVGAGNGGGVAMVGMGGSTGVGAGVKAPSLWFKNYQLSFYSIPFALLYIFLVEPKENIR
jgi:hypothetical protein